MTRSLQVVRVFLLGVLPVAAQTESVSVAAAPPSRILAPAPAFRFPNGQKFVYSVQWHMLNAGTATIGMRRSQAGEHLTSTADTAGMTNKIFPVHDVFDADIDPMSFCTTKVVKHSEEGSRRQDRTVQFDYARRLSIVDEKDLKTGELKHTEVASPACSSDIITAFIYASSLPLTNGYTEMFPVNDRGKTTDVRIQVETREKIKVPSGEYHTVRVKAEPFSGAMKGKGVLWVWFTDDEKHVPVQMKSKLGFAALLFQLQRIDPQPGGP